MSNPTVSDDFIRNAGTRGSTARFKRFAVVMHPPGDYDARKFLLCGEHDGMSWY